MLVVLLSQDGAYQMLARYKRLWHSYEFKSTGSLGRSLNNGRRQKWQKPTYCFWIEHSIVIQFNAISRWCEQYKPMNRQVWHKASPLSLWHCNALIQERFKFCVESESQIRECRSEWHCLNFQSFNSNINPPEHTLLHIMMMMMIIINYCSDIIFSITSLRNILSGGRGYKKRQQLGNPPSSSSSSSS